MIQTIERTFASSGETEIHDLTPALRAIVHESGLREGQVLVFVPGSTAGVTTIEHEPGLIRDLGLFFERLIPRGAAYHHHETWGDDNGSSHVRAALLKPSLTIPVVEGQPILGTWQQVVLIDFDTRPRDRRVVFQVSGDD